MTDGTKGVPETSVTPDHVRQIIGEQLVIMRKQLTVLRSIHATNGASGPPTDLRVLADGGPSQMPARRAMAPLTDVQRDVWVTCQWSDEASAAHNISTLLGLKGELDVDILHQALRRLVRRHEALRTTFEPDGRRQVIAPDAEVELPVLDVSEEPDSVRSARVDEFLDAEMSTPYELAVGPLFRATLIRYAADDHVLVLSMHHLVGDGWSNDVIRSELGQIYAALLRGESAALDEPTQYREYADWRTEQAAASKEYWTQLHGPAPVRLELPTDKARPALQSYRYGSARAMVGQPLLSSLKDLAAAQRVTLFNVLLTGWEILLHRLSDQGDFVHGLFVAGQPGMGVRSLVGFCTNPLPLRARIEPAERVSDLLKRSRHAIADALDNRYYSFGQLAREQQLKPDPSRLALVSAAVTMESTQSEIEFGGLEAAGQDHGRRSFGPFDLELYLMESIADVTVDLQYATDLFERSTIELWLGYFVSILAQMGADATAQVSGLRLPGESEMAADPAQRDADLDDVDRKVPRSDLELLARWNDTSHPYPDEAVVHELFDAQAAAKPAATALVYEGKTVTYGELLDRSNRLAHHLIEKGVASDVPVGVAISRSPEMIVAILAVTKAGGAYLPLDPALPAERLSGIIRDAEASLILTAADVDSLVVAGAEQIAINDFDGSAYPSTSPIDRSRPDDTFFVIFTSGSTGRPKGVQATHRGMLNRFAWQWEAYPFSEGEVCCQKTSLGFVDHAWEVWGPLLKGRTLVLITDEAVADGERFIDTLAEHGIERVVTVPSLFKALLHAFPGMGEKLPRLRYWTLSGERLTDEVVADFRAALPDVVLLNLYGMSEGSGDATWYDDRWGVQGGSYPIGRPINNMRIHLLDDEQRRLPIGDVGEIWLAGVGLAKAYVGRPDLTRARFLPEPFGDDPAARMYRTGDLGRWLPDGVLEYVGRADDQVKIRGIRVEPGEIEAVARSLDGVDDAVVTTPRIGQELQVVAYVTRAGDASMTPAEVRAALADRLPEYLVPSRVIFLDRLPLNPHGKIDRGALPDPSDEDLASHTPYEEPRSALERQLAGIWQELLGIQRVGVHDNFFELGGDSLLALRCVSRANRAGMKLAPISLLQHQTIAELAGLAADATEPLVEDQEVVTGPTPLTPAQLRFLEERKTPDAHHWNLSTFVRAERLSPTALRSAVEALVRHHDALRLRLWREGDGWRQETAGLPAAPPFESHDVSGLPPDEQAAEIERVCAELQGSIDLGAGVLLRVAHFDRGPRASDRLFITVHHFAVDGMTWPVLLQDFEHLNRQAEAGVPLSLPAKTSSIKEWATSLEQMARQPDVVEAADEWLRLPWQQLAPLPIDYPAERHHNTNGSSATVECEFSSEETHALLEGRTRPEHLVLAALARSLSRWQSSPTVLIDILNHGRSVTPDGVDLSRTVGFTLSYNPLVVSHPTWEEARETVEHVAAQVDSGPPGSTFELLRFMAPDPELRRRLSELPRADVLFNYAGPVAEPLHGTPWTEAAEASGRDQSPRGLRQYALAVRTLMDPNLRIIFIYSRGLHRPETIEEKAAEVAASIRRLGL